MTSLLFKLSAIFLWLCPYPDASWNVLGAGIRLAAEVGAHRRWKNATAKHDAEFESYNRVMWLVLSSSLRLPDTSIWQGDGMPGSMG